MVNAQWIMLIRSAKKKKKAVQHERSGGNSSSHIMVSCFPFILLEIILITRFILQIKSFFFFFSWNNSNSRHLSVFPGTTVRCDVRQSICKKRHTKTHTHGRTQTQTHTPRIPRPHPSTKCPVYVGDPLIYSDSWETSHPKSHPPPSQTPRQRPCTQ